MKIEQLLRRIETTEDNLEFKNSMLGIIQLYFNGLVERREGNWEEQSELWGRLFEAGKLTISEFYPKRNISFSEVRSMISPYVEEIISNSSEGEYKVKRHLMENKRGIKSKTRKIAGLLRDEIDVIVPVASGGFELSLLIADFLPSQEFLPIRYSWRGKNDRRVLTPCAAPEDYSHSIRGKKILIVDDVISSGTTVKNVIEWARSIGSKGIYFTATDVANVDMWNGFGFTSLTDNLYCED